MEAVQVFDLYSERYDSWYTRNRILALNELRAIKRILSPKIDPCIEIGVGTGWFSYRIGCGYGIDPSIGMLRKAKQRGIEVIQGLGVQLPLKSYSCKTVLLIVTLCFVKDPFSVLEESSRVTGLDGSLIICIVPRNSPWGKYYRELGIRGHPFYSIAKFYTPKEIESYMSLLGFHLDDCIGVLKFKPTDSVVEEEPEKCEGGEGFICMKFKRRIPQVSQSYR
jgi:ubiquinone/menaquinone biosynthesis C-methylase UbiE